ncbi:MAG: DUF2225 domain-containing protein [Lachnospiraceae bacterium]|nr:DUF2225 domain-containing protein [Lachnospiraceae bacterium]MDE6742312.1 DUF2225 domain-containing protein [Lachnospiraceae bacterium]
MSILSGLESLGLGGLENVNIYGSDKDKKESGNPEEKNEKAVINEEDYLLQKTFECPVCDEEFKQSIIRHNKIRNYGHDLDLRPRNEGVDTLKYDVVVCNHCGYANMVKFHGPLPRPHRKMLQENIMPKFKPMQTEGIVITYEEAVIRYKLALMNAVVRQAKDSEKAFIALKLSWIYRGMRETLPKDTENYEDTVEMLMAQERENQKIALEGFSKAMTAETPPYAGLNDDTLDYLLAVLNMEAGEYAKSKRILSSILSSPKATKVQRSQAEEVLEELKKRMK